MCIHMHTPIKYAAFVSLCSLFIIVGISFDWCGFKDNSDIISLLTIHSSLLYWPAILLYSGIFFSPSIY